MAGLAAVRDIRESVAPPTTDELEAFETDLLAQFVMARSSAGLTDVTVRDDVRHLETIREWLSRPLWSMTPADADCYFGGVMRRAAVATRGDRAGTLRLFFRYLDLRYRGEIHRLTGHVVECPIDEVNVPRGHADQKIRIPPTDKEIERLFTSWRTDLASVRRFATAARTYAAARLMATVGLRINELRMLDLDDVHPELGSLGKLHVRHAKGANGSGPRTRIVPLINGSDRVLRWYIEDIRGLFDGPEHWDRPGAPLFPSERHNRDGSATRATAVTLREGVQAAVEQHLPEWAGALTPHVLRHYCASQLYLSGMDLIAVQELLGHRWIATTMNYVHVHSRHVETAWEAAERRAALRLGGALR